jgi:hypothetical protein
MNNRITGCTTLHAHLQPFLTQTLDEIKNREIPSRQAWLDEIEELRRTWPDTNEIVDMPGINPTCSCTSCRRNRARHQRIASTSGSIRCGRHSLWNWGQISAF